MQFVYTVQNEMGLHLGPAQIIAQEAQKFNSTMTISAKNKSADMKKVFGIVGLGAKCGEQIFVEIQGEDEEAAASSIQAVLQNL